MQALEWCTNNKINKGLKNRNPNTNILQYFRTLQTLGLSLLK